MARGESPAAATTYNPQSSVSVSDPTPGATADITVSFSLNAPDAFPNLTREPTIQFIPRQWGINAGAADSAPIGAIAGSFNVLTNVGILGFMPCIFPTPADFTMYEASVDTTRPTSALDVADSHPGGLGYSGQFMPDLDTAQGPPSDFGQRLVPFVTLGNNQVGNEFRNGPSSWYSPLWGLNEAVYRDNDGSGTTAVDGSGVTVGDTRLTAYSKYFGPYPAGSVVAPGDAEFFGPDWNRRFIPMLAYEKHTDPNGNGLMDPGEAVYDDYDNSGDVSYNDVRQFEFEGKPAGSTSVAPKGYLFGGVSRYPDFLAQMFPPDVVGEPLARMWGGQTVVAAVVSVNLVTFRPGQLPGFPATMGYPTVTIVLDPVAAPDLAQNNFVNATCTPLSLTSTNFAVSKDNPKTPLTDEGGYVRLTNPMAEKDHTFTLVTTSDYDTDNDGIENWLDTCDFTPNTPAGDNGRQLFGFGPGDTEYDPDWGMVVGDGLNEACDPDPNSFTQNWGALGQKDQDLDGYNNVADNCPLTPNGYSGYTTDAKNSPPFWFFWAVGYDPVGLDNQADTDGDRIGDACDPDPLTPTGHKHVVSVVNAVPIFKHGIKLNNLGGPKTIKDNGARTYSVDVSNLGSSAEDVRVGLRVVEGCAAVSGPSSVSVAADGSATASFTVDWTGCAAGPYTVQADACHAGDAAPVGLFGSGACPGTSDGMTDPNPLDDAPIAKSVEVGSP